MMTVVVVVSDLWVCSVKLKKFDENLFFMMSCKVSVICIAQVIYLCAWVL